MKLREYAVSIMSKKSNSCGIPNVAAATPSEAAKLAVRALGGGPLNEIRLTSLDGGILAPEKLKNNQVYVRADLLGGTRESCHWYLAETRVKMA